MFSKYFTRVHEIISLFYFSSVYSVYEGPSSSHQPIHTQQKPMQMVNISPAKRQVENITFVSPKNIQVVTRAPVRDERSKNSQFITLRQTEPQVRNILY